VNENVLLVTAPMSLTNCPGTTASFSASATGTSLSYQWYKGDGILIGKTENILTIPVVATTDAGTYRVVVSGTCGNSVSSSATLTVNENVVLVTGPLSLTNCPGTTASFIVSATGTGLSYQWYKGEDLLSGKTESILTIPAVTATNAGIYQVVVSGTCGNSISSSAELAVNSAVTATPLQNLARCAGESASFSTAAQGTGPFTYTWQKNGQTIEHETSDTLHFASVSANDAGNYTVIVNGACTSVTNTASLVVNASTAASPLASAMKNLGETVTFTTQSTGTGPFSYVWKKNGSVLTGQLGDSLVLTNLAYSDAALYTVEVSGTCGTASQSATLAVNHPPTVSIVSPTNGTVFLSPANFAVLADAQDSDGVVTRVEFFQSVTNKIGETTNSAPYFILLTNLDAGTYTFTARATDDLGATGVSTPVTVTVVDRLPITVISSLRLNPQTGLYEQKVSVYNPTYSTLDAIRVYVGNLTNDTVVYNPSGVTNGIAYVESYKAVPPGSSIEFLIEYYIPSRILPNPTLRATLVPPNTGGGVAVSGIGQRIDRGLLLPDKTFLVEFSTISNRVYYVQYSGDLKEWQTAVPAITGNGTRIQWLDNGQPKTVSAPSSEAARFYRLIMLP